MYEQPLPRGTETEVQKQDVHALMRAWREQGRGTGIDWTLTRMTQVGKFHFACHLVVALIRKAQHAFVHVEQHRVHGTCGAIFLHQFELIEQVEWKPKSGNETGTGLVRWIDCTLSANIQSVRSVRAR